MPGITAPRLKTTLGIVFGVTFLAFFVLLVVYLWQYLITPQIWANQQAKAPSFSNTSGVITYTVGTGEPLSASLTGSVDINGTMVQVRLNETGEGIESPLGVSGTFTLSNTVKLPAPAVSPEVEADSQAEPAAQSSSTKDAVFLSILLLGFCGAVIGGFYLYLAYIQPYYYQASGKAIEAGYGVVTTWADARDGAGNANIATNGKPKDLEITGLGSIFAFEESPPFTVKRRTTTGSLEDVTDANWSIVSGPETLLVPSIGASIRLTPKSIGDLLLKVDDGKSASIEFPVKVVLRSTAQQTTEIAFIGRGYGSFILAFGVMGIAAVLGLTGVINSEAVVAVLTGASGYAFGAATAGKGGKET